MRQAVREQIHIKAPKRILMRMLACLFLITTPAHASTNLDVSDATFNEAVRAVKDKDYQHAVRLFTLQAEADQHDAQYNLALLIKAGKGTPQNFQKALSWSWAASLGGIEAAVELAEELADMIPEKIVEEARETVAARLRQRIENGDKQAVPQLAAYHLNILEEEDYGQAYIWYAIAAAIGIDGSIAARDEVMDNVDDEEIIELQREAGTIFEGLSFD